MSEKEQIPQEWVEAARDALRDHGIDIDLPSEGYLDDMERERFDGLVAALAAVIPLICADEREACERAIVEKAREIGRQECCGRGMPSACNNYEECCGSPDLMLTDAEAASAIRSRTEAET